MRGLAVLAAIAAILGAILWAEEALKRREGHVRKQREANAARTKGPAIGDEPR